MIARILVVEDDEDIREGNVDDLRQINDAEKQELGIEEFIIDKAATKEDAMAWLERATEALPYDLILLDLSLPSSETNLEELPDRGLDILSYVQKTGASRGVIISSCFSGYDYVARAFRGGAIDFIAKPFGRMTLQKQVLEALKKVQMNMREALEAEGSNILDRRVGELVPYAEKMLTYKLGICFSRFVQSVVNEIERLEDEFKERWGLDIERDSQDPQVQRLVALEGSVRNAKREWSGILSSIIKGDEAPGVCVVEDLLSEIKSALFPCLSLKKVQLTDALQEATIVRTFQDDARVVIKEIILGALSELTNDDNSSRRMKVSITRTDVRAEVRFEDNLPSLGAQTADSINHGVSLPPEPRFGRAWGLSVAQHIALRGGGRIKVEPNSNGSVISYLIPLAEHA